MKKITNLLLIIATALTLTACNRFGDDNLPQPTALEPFSPTVTTSKLWSQKVGEGDAEQHHDDNHRGSPPVAQEVGNGRQAQQQKVEWVPGAADQLRERALLALMRDEVWADDA